MINLFSTTSLASNSVLRSLYYSSPILQNENESLKLQSAYLNTAGKVSHFLAMPLLYLATSYSTSSCLNFPPI